MVVRLTFLLFFLTIIPGTSFSVNRDSLLADFRNEHVSDSMRINAVKLLAASYMRENLDSVFSCYERLLQFGKEKNNKRAYMEAYIGKATCLIYSGNIDEALKCTEKSISLGMELGDTVHIISCYNVFGSIYYKAAAYAKSLENFQEVLRISSKIKYIEGLLTGYTNMGAVYYFQENYDMALKYWEMSLSLYPNPESNSSLDDLYNNIGAIYERKELYDTAMTYFLKSMEIRQKTNNKPGIAASYLNIGTNYSATGKYKTAFAYIDSAYNLYKTLNDYLGLSAIHYSRGELYWKTQKYTKGIAECKQGLRYSEKIKEITWQRDNCDCLSKNYEALGDYESALIYCQKYILLRDSMKNESTDRKIAQKEVEYEYIQKAELDSIHNAEMMKVQKAELKAQDRRLKNEKTYKAALGFGLLGVALFLFLLYRRFIIARKQKTEIEEKNKHITDSIHYAKRIQDAILTSEQDMKEALDDYFVYYHPKDIVSGDFYWVYKINNEKVMLAVASSSGEGVPGAFMGMIGTALLNEIVIENGITDVVEVAAKMQEQLMKTFKKRNPTNYDFDIREKDYMKLSLICLNKATKKLEFVGAGQPLYLVRNTSLSEIYGNEHPIEFSLDAKINYSKKEVQLEAGDMLYLSTGGAINQLGKQYFVEQLEGITNRTMKEQNEQLGIALNKAAKTNASKDDACILGVRI